MAIRNIVYSDDPLIRKKSKKVTDFSENLWELLDDMKDTMRKNNGCGLAAVQVGVLKQAVVVEVNRMFLELINPEILEEIGEACEIEGCLSVKNITGEVERPYSITVKALTRYNEEITITTEGLLTVVLCHEIDHLDGIIFTDKVINNTNNGIDK